MANSVLIAGLFVRPTGQMETWYALSTIIRNSQGGTRN
jgi:hypothetical protein